MNASAAIRRATQRAQNAMRELDAQNVAELLRIYESAAAEVRQRIARATDSSDSVPLQNLRAMLRDIEAIIDALAEQRDQLLLAAIERAAELGVEPFTLQGIVRVGGSQAVLDSAAATRVSQAAVNRAHGEAFMAGGEATPGRAGWRYLLSPLHPAPDICDLLSRQNLHGLGPGVYPTRETTPWPAHPNTLSFIQMVFDDEVTDADRTGKETAIQALDRLTPEQRAGAVGVTKAEYFDRGLLRRGMIRSSTGAVAQLLQRQGAIPR